jgi:hypothetical protein
MQDTTSTFNVCHIINIICKRNIITRGLTPPYQNVTVPYIHQQQCQTWTVPQQIWYISIWNHGSWQNWGTGLQVTKMAVKWCHPVSPRPKELRQELCRINVMIIIMYDTNIIIFYHKIKVHSSKVSGNKIKYTLYGYCKQNNDDDDNKSSSSSSLSPLCRVFIHIFLRQTMSLSNTMLQLFCRYSLCRPYYHHRHRHHHHHHHT